MSSLGDRLNAARRVHGPDDAVATDETSEMPAAPRSPWTSPTTAATTTTTTR